MTDPATDLMSFLLGRDVLGNLTASDATGAGQLDVGYTYDVLNRLVTAAYDTGSESFDMDSLGNRNNYTDSRDGDAITYGTNNPVNEYTTIEGIGVAYDPAGNLITDEQGIGYSYDADNRLAGIASSTETLSFDYDAIGRRIRKTNGGESTLYYYDGENVIAEYDGTGALLRTFIQGHQYIDERAVMTTAGIDAYYLIGNLYSVSGLANANGAIVESYTYDAYGDVEISDRAGASIPDSALGNPYAFTGRRIDKGDIDLYYYRARYYDPRHGRFMRRDPLESTGVACVIRDGLPVIVHPHMFRQGFESERNLYAYVQSRPTYFVDPWGLFSRYIGCDCDINSNGTTDKIEVQEAANLARTNLHEVINGMDKAITRLNNDLASGSLNACERNKWNKILKYTQNARRIARLSRNYIGNGIVHCHKTCKYAAGAYVECLNNDGIHLCYGWFNEALVSPLYQASALVHEASHIYGTLDADFTPSPPQYESSTCKNQCFPFTVPNPCSFDLLAYSYQYWTQVGKFRIPCLDYDYPSTNCIDCSKTSENDPPNAQCGRSGSGTLGIILVLLCMMRFISSSQNRNNARLG